MNATFKRNRGTHSDAAKLAIWAHTNKALVEEQIEKGKTLQAFAAERGCTYYALKAALKAAGITSGRDEDHRPAPPLVRQVDACTKVLARIAKALDVDHSELLPFLK